jgi:cellulose synthase (UDP-forming)
MKRRIFSRTLSQTLLVINVFIALLYLSWWFRLDHAGHPVLYGLLFFGEIYHVLMALTFWFTLWPYKRAATARKTIAAFTPSVDVLIPVAGEPVDIVQATVKAAQKMRYPHFTIFILNDGFVAGKSNWREVEVLAQEMGVKCITRTVGGGAKAGNINHALKHTTGDIVVIFDADMAAEPSFLEKVIPYFKQERLAFVQTPQFYRNTDQHAIAATAWEQQSFFFGSIMRGKERTNAAFICGTNVAIRRKALAEVGGMCEDNIAEDFLTSLRLHQRGWESRYLSEVLSSGLAPEDLLSYYRQQLRWARGPLEVLFKDNPFFKRGLTWSQRIHYFASALYYFNGVIVLIDCVMPLLFLYFGLVPVATDTVTFALFFIPFMVANLYTLRIASRGTATFRSLSLTHGTWVLQLEALLSVLLRRKMEFVVTPKQAQMGNFIHLAYPHLIYMVLAAVGVAVAIAREGFNPSVVTNIAWVAFNVVLFMPFIVMAYPWRRFIFWWQPKPVVVAIK